MRMSAFAITTILLFGCATAGRMNQVSLGMTKGQVVSVLGSPESTSATGDVEYLIYRLSRKDPNGSVVPVREDYFVRLRAGKVDAYGQKGDFNSTNNPTLDLNINK